MNDRQLLDEVIEFRRLLLEYSRKVGKRETRDDAAKLRTELSIKWGRISADLIRIGFSPYLESYGRRFPIMQMVLRDGPFGPDYETMRTVNQGLEQAIGRLQHKLEEEPAKAEPVNEEPPKAGGRRLPFITGGLLALGLMVLAWAFGRFQDTIWNDFAQRYTWCKDLLFTGNTPWIVTASVVAGLSIGLLGNQLSKEGVVGGFRRRPVWTLFNLLLTVIFTAVVVVLSK